MRKWHLRGILKAEKPLFSRDREGILQAKNRLQNQQTIRIELWTQESFGDQDAVIGIICIEVMRDVAMG